MGSKSNSDKAAENERLITFAKEPVDLDIPIDYIETVICGQGCDCLTAALEDKPAANKLFQLITMGYMLQLDVLKHEGKVERVLKEMSANLVNDSIHAMKELGYQW